MIVFVGMSESKIACVAVTGGVISPLDEFDPIAMCMKPVTLAISVTGVTRKMYSVKSNLSTSKGCQV